MNSAINLDAQKGLQPVPENWHVGFTSADFEVSSAHRPIALQPPQSRGSFEFSAAPVHSGRGSIALDVSPLGWDTRGTATIPLGVVPTVWEVFCWSLALSLLLWLILESLRAFEKSRAKLLKQYEEKIHEAEVKIEREPEKARPAWDLAQLKLEKYIDRNVSQVRSVFRLAVAATTVGVSLCSRGSGDGVAKTRIPAEFVTCERICGST
jgi:hypothetical protein